MDPNDTVSLKAYFEMRLNTMQELLDQRARTSDLAINKAEKTIEHRLEGLNEFRAALSDQTAQMPSRVEMDAKFEAVNARIHGLQRIVWLGIGALAAVQFLFQYLTF